MLSQNQLVVQRRIIETTYDRLCNIIEFRGVKNSVGATTFKEVVVLKELPCRLSYKTSETAVLNELSLSKEVKQRVKIFLAPEVKILPNSKIVVGECSYGKTSKSKVYSTHQEVELELLEK